MKTSGRPWWEHLEHYSDKLQTPQTIAFAFVATHNHFVLDHGGKVFNRSAPIIKLAQGATEDVHLALLAYLNSSTACFWMKQVFQPKHSAEHMTHPEPERDRFEHAATQLEQLPLPPQLHEDQRLIECARQLGELAKERHICRSRSQVELGLSKGDLAAHLRATWKRFDTLRERMIAYQEEIDWRTYVCFGLADATVLGDLEDSASCPRGDRPCERVIPRKSFVRDRDHLVPLSDAEIAPVGVLAASLARTWNTRTESIRRTKLLQLIEQPLFKRQWRDTDDNVDEFTFRRDTDRARLEDWLLERAEVAISGIEGASTLPSVVSRIAPPAHAEQVAALLINGEGDYRSVVKTLFERESVPFLAAYRYTDSGLDRYAEWQQTWDLQHRQDAGEEIDDIPVPPRYGQGDYRSVAFYKLRGPLDVPKERFISYPGCESDYDHEPVYGWAGWGYEQRAKALATLYWRRKTEENWGRDRLTPMLAGLLELSPWLKQRHSAPLDDYAGDSPANYYAGFLDGECHTLGLTLDDLSEWRPPQKVRTRKTPATAGARKKRATEARVTGGVLSTATPKTKAIEKARSDAEEAAE
jgi:hypothetical protein